MISEKQLVSSFSGFWNECLPFLNPQMVSDLNLRGVRLSTADAGLVKPLTDRSDNSNNDIVSEMAFGLFSKAAQSNKTVEEMILDVEVMMQIKNEAAERIVNLRSNEDLLTAEIEIPKRREDITLAKRLQNYFKTQYPGEKILIQPRFLGSGVLDSCFGDFLVNKTLVEVKMVERNLRGVDLRQILVYCALNHQSQQYQISDISLLNPRRGIEFKFNVEELVFKISKKTSADLFHIIIDFLSNPEMLGQTS